MSRENIIERARDLFGGEVERPTLTLRGGEAIDVYDLPPPYDAEVDRPTPAYLEQNASGLHYLDPVSWRYYLPYFLERALQTVSGDSMWATDALLQNLRPPDRDPPRFAALTKQQEEIITAVLEELAFADDSAYQDAALQVLEEYWIPGALYRPKLPDG